MNLETYLSEEHEGLRRRIDKVRSTLGQVSNLLSVSWNSISGWPYIWPLPNQKTARTPTPGDDIKSVSTQAMCSWAVEELLKADEKRNFLLRERTKDLKEKQSRTLAKLGKQLQGNLSKRSKVLWHSSTFGENDVFTAAWLVLSLHRAELDQPVLRTRLAQFIVVPMTLPAGRANGPKELGIAKDGAARFVNANQSLFRTEDNQAAAHPLPLLKAVRALRILKKSYYKDIAPNLQHYVTKIQEEAGLWFERNLHRQLSFYHFSDFRFDAAELIFCLAGALETGEIAYPDSVIENALQVVRESQVRSVYWRPYRPMLVNARGQVLIPLSIEIASALLEVLQRTDLFGQYSDTLTKYYDWLITQLVPQAEEARDEASAWAGWHSENAYETRLVHVWDTALRSVFLINYWNSLAEDINHRILSSFSVRQPRSITIVPGRFVPPDKNLAGWSFDDIVRDLEEHRLYSLLLYGPPGTSKTSFAEVLAKKLGRPLVCVSPSDFLVRGESGIEEQAKLLFRALNALENVVILFDEIDRMILDRDSEAYGSEGETFQFMTPSMLLKLRELRDTERSIFLIATNLAERIDGPAKRAGRVDRRILCAPFTMKDRVRTLRDLVGAAVGASDLAWAAFEQKIFRDVASKTALHVYQSLRSIVDRAASEARRHGKGEAVFRADLLKELARQEPEAPEIKLAIYEDRDWGRLEGSKYPQKPYEEYLALLLLRGEVPNGQEDREKFRQRLKEWRQKDPESARSAVARFHGFASASGASHLDEWMKED